MDVFRTENNCLKFHYDAEELWIQPWGANSFRIRATKLAEMPKENWALEMPVEDIVPGMRGIAKTVIEGDTIEELNIEVLGVIGNDAMGHNILIKASGDVIDRSGGIAQGMSGSPVYINGRLAGAVAFGKAFTDPKYCFLTPIGTFDGRRFYRVRCTLFE